MRYYKLIDEDKIIGAITSNNFIRYQPVIKCFLRGDETNGEYVSYKNQLYRSTWMVPITKQEEFIEVIIAEIDEVEYHIYETAIQNNDELIIVPDYEPVEEIEYIDPNTTMSIQFVKDSKINEMSYTCRHTIENGFDLELRGETHHFSLSAQDQLNLMSASILMQTEQLIPYHADNEPQKFYTTAEMQLIINGANNHRNYHTTYYNALKAYINSLDSIEAIAAVTYGTPIPEAFQSEVWQVMIH